MSVRKIKPYMSSSDFIQKTIDIDRVIPRFNTVQDFEQHRDEFNKREYLSIYQTLAEADLWFNSSCEDRRILAPIVDFYYDKYNRPVIVYPRFKPLVDEQEAFRLEEDEIIAELRMRLSEKGMTDEDIGYFIEKVTNFCDEYDLSIDDTLLNLNNIGWNDTFGVRLIDFGLTNEAIEKFQEKLT